MKVLIGKSGLGKSWQDEFSENVKCKKCGKNARIVFVAYEDGDYGEKFVYDLHKNTGEKKNGKFWPHDAIACAVYLCEECFEPSTILNQA